MYFTEIKTINDVSGYVTNTNVNTMSCSDAIGDNLYVVTGNTAHVRSTSAKYGSFAILCENLEIGDIIEVECEFNWVNGNKPSVGIDELQNVIEGVASTVYTKNITIQGQWEKIYNKYIVQNKTYGGNHRIRIGLGTSEVGEYKVRKIRWKIFRKSKIKKLNVIETNEKKTLVDYRTNRSTTVPYSNTLSLNTFTFDDENKIVEVYKDNATYDAYFSSHIPKAKTNDIIEVEFDFYKIDNINPTVNIYELNGVPISSTISSKFSRQYNVPTGVWTTIKAKYIVTNSTYTLGSHLISVGTNTTTVGKFKLRNYKVNLYSEVNYSNVQKVNCYIDKLTNFRIRDDYYSNNCTLSVVDTQTLRLTFGQSFVKKPNIFISTIFSNASYKYDFRIGNVSETYCDIKVYEKTGIVAKDLSTIEDYVGFFINVVQ